VHRNIPGMPIHVFRTECEPRVIALANEIGAANLLPTMGPWHRAPGHSATGVVGLPDFIRAAVAERGYILLYVGREIATPSRPIALRANDG
jgi:hypothetical protein